MHVATQQQQDTQRWAYSVYEFATHTGTPVSTVYDAVRSGQIKSVRIGLRRIMIPRAEVDRFLMAIPAVAAV